MRWFASIFFALSACATPPQLPTINVDHNADDRMFAREPDLWWSLQEFPQDNKPHLSGSIERLKDKTGNPIGWQVMASVKFAWPLLIKPPVPPRPMPPIGDPQPEPEDPPTD